MWNGKIYDEFQEAYQFKSGLYLIEKLESINSVANKAVLDLGCGNGKLTQLLWEKANKPVIAVDADDSMLAVLKEKYSAAEIEIICADIPGWLSSQNIAVDVIFSNATFHWFGSHESMKQILRDCHNNLTPNGVMALRLSLKENALDIKQYLEERLSEYLGKKEKPYLKQSELEYSKFLLQLKRCDFKISYSEEIRFVPFDNPRQDFEFMVKSQPIQKYFTNQTFKEFEQFLQGCWIKQKEKLQSHHGIFIAQKHP